MNAQRILARVEKLPDAPGCWLWTGSTNADGYGKVRVRPRAMRYAHRVAYELFRGDVPADRWVLHRCDVPSCVRPDHLFLGTHDENMADMVAKGRQAMGDARSPLARGEANGNARLTEADVVALRSRFAAGGVSKAALAREFRISRAAASQILRGRKWGHVP